MTGARTNGVLIFAKTAELEEDRAAANRIGELRCAQAVAGASLGILPRPMRVHV